MRIGRKPKALIAIVTAATALLATFAIAPSLASWTDTEFDHGNLASLSCAAPGSFTTAAWGQEVSGSVAGIPLDSHLAGTLGVSAASGAPHSTATGGAGSAGLTYLTNDAWSNNLQVGALNSISLGAGVTPPIGQNLGAETQYGRATSNGVSIGASGLLTSAGGGLVSLATPTGTTPGVGSISLDSALSSIVGSQLSADVTQLANASVEVGAVGSTTQVDSCSALWQGESDAAAVIRHYVLAKLGLAFSSSLVGTVVTDARGAVTSLSTALNALQPVGTTVTNSALTTGLTDALSAAGVGIGGPTSIQAGVTFDLSGVTSLLTSTLTSGPVSVNLGTGQITADIGTLAGVDLNALPANSPLISATTLEALTSHLADAVDTFIAGPFTTALTTAVNTAVVSVHVSTDISILSIDAASVGIDISGSVGRFLTPAGPGGPPTVTVSDLAVGGASALLQLLGVDLNQVLTDLLSGVVAPVIADVVPAVASTVVTPTLALATTAVTSTVNVLSVTTLPIVLASLGTVVNLIGDAVQLTVNAQPDQANPVGSPETAAAGRYFESALKVGVLNGAGGTSVLALYLGSSSVGPNLEN